mmetsp:Transcript_13035/g.20555  ORF Transcript_13035/g.20555 Transcript_13035/m.20555 type:complete len:111 (-) Transcript_13035:303-635(-)
MTRRTSDQTLTPTQMKVLSSKWRKILWSLFKLLLLPTRLPQAEKVQEMLKERFKSARLGQIYCSRVHVIQEDPRIKIEKTTIFFFSSHYRYSWPYPLLEYIDVLRTSNVR